MHLPIGPFEKELDPTLLTILTSLIDQGLSPRVVGGITRDWFLFQRWGKDWDIEVATQNTELSKSWESDPESFREKIVDRLSQGTPGLHSEVLTFSVIRICWEDYEVELSLPRREKYLSAPPYGHSEFEVEFQADMSVTESFKRRDFTVNAMSFEFFKVSPSASLSCRFLDPYDGFDDLSSKLLRPCDSENFYHDPVRLLRALRFGLILGWRDFSHINFANFNLEKLTIHYVLKEALKSNNSSFFKLFFKIVGDNDLKVSSLVQKLAPFVYLKVPYTNPKDSLVNLLVHADSTGLPFQRIESLGRALGMKKNWLKGVITLKKFESYWENFSLSSLQKTLREQSLDKGLQNIFFERLLQVHSTLLSLEQTPETLYALFPKKVHQDLKKILDPPKEFSVKAKEIYEKEDLDVRLRGRVEIYLAILEA